MRLERPLGGRLDLAASSGHALVAFGTAPELRQYYRYAPTDPEQRSDTRGGDPGKVPVPNVALSGTSLVTFDADAWRELWARTPGSEQPRCMTTEGRTDVRSGEFIAGNFSAFVNAWDGTEETSKLYFVPLDPQVARWGEPPPPLTVVADLLEGPAPLRTTAIFDSHSLSNTGALFYATGTVLPEAGTWRLTVTAGNNQGCFEVVV